MSKNLNDHYTKLGITPFDYSMANGLDAMQHSIVKYVTRFRSKNGMEDLRKAADVLDQLIAHEANVAEEEAEEAFPEQDVNVSEKPIQIPIGKTAVLELVTQLLKEEVVVGLDRIVAIPRGGLSVAHVIAEHLGVKDVELYNPDIVYEGNVLLVDDINDTGDTLIGILSHPGRFIRGTVITAVLAQRYNSKLKASFVGEHIKHDNYVLFPWEA